MEDRTGGSYNEAAFLYFFNLERKRSERTRRPLVLLLVDLEPRNGSDRCFEPRTAAEIFASLRRGLRDTDVVGWHKEGRVVGALLTSHREAAGPTVESVIYNRVARILRHRLRQDGGPRIQVRVYLPTQMTMAVGQS